MSMAVLDTYDNTIHIHITNEFLLIFGETIFVEVPKIHKINEIYGPQKKSTLWYIILTF